MPGPTTEVLNEDLKGLRTDVQTIAVGPGRADVQGRCRRRTQGRCPETIAVGLAALTSKVDTALGVAKWIATAFTTLAVTGIVSAAWWASGINAEIRHLDGAMTKLATQAEKSRSPLPDDLQKPPTVPKELHDQDLSPTKHDTPKPLIGPAGRRSFYPILITILPKCDPVPMWS